MNKSKGIIYYTNNNIDRTIASAVMDFIFEANLPIWSASLQPIRFGDNVVFEGKSGYPMMVRQIISCLERANTDVVFFCEHDVLYHSSHFSFTPEKDDTFYYNLNSWRWDYPQDRLIHYDNLISLSQLCVNRKLALEHYLKRLDAISKLPPDTFESKEPKQVRIWGYEPGRKTVTSGGFSEEKSEIWSSKYPNIDIRHDKTFSPRKTTLESFKHSPTGWEEKKLNDIPGWNIREIFNLWS